MKNTILIIVAAIAITFAAEAIHRKQMQPTIPQPAPEQKQDAQTILAALQADVLETPLANGPLGKPFYDQWQAGYAAARFEGKPDVEKAFVALSRLNGQRNRFVEAYDFGRQRPITGEAVQERAKNDWKKISTTQAL